MLITRTRTRVVESQHHRVINPLRTRTRSGWTRTYVSLSARAYLSSYLVLLHCIWLALRAKQTPFFRRSIIARDALQLSLGRATACVIPRTMYRYMCVYTSRAYLLHPRRYNVYIIAYHRETVSATDKRLSDLCAHTQHITRYDVLSTPGPVDYASTTPSQT